jgi:hypothetical protein
VACAKKAMNVNFYTNTILIECPNASFIRNTVGCLLKTLLVVHLLQTRATTKNVHFVTSIPTSESKTVRGMNVAFVGTVGREGFESLFLILARRKNTTGPHCKSRHRRRVLCIGYMNGLCVKGPLCKHAHPTFDLPKMEQMIELRNGRLITCHNCNQKGHKVSVLERQFTKCALFLGITMSTFGEHGSCVGATTSTTTYGRRTQ